MIWRICHKKLNVKQSGSAEMPVSDNFLDFNSSISLEFLEILLPKPFVIRRHGGTKVLLDARRGQIC